MARFNRNKFFAVPAQAASGANASGSLTVTNASTLFTVGQIVTLKATGQSDLSLMVKKIPNANNVILGSTSATIDTGTDISAYTVSPTLEAAEQERPIIPGQDAQQRIIENDPILAQRVIQVNKDGDFLETFKSQLVLENGTNVNGSNPLPVSATISESFINTDDILSIGINQSLTVPAFPAIKPLTSFKVPSGKKLKLLSLMADASAAGIIVHAFTRKNLWNFAFTALGTPAAPALAQSTKSGGGLTLVSTYRYKIVARNNVGNTAASAEASITLSGTNNAVTLTITALTGALVYDIYRTSAGGASNSQKYLGSTDALTFVDISPDADLENSITPPGATTTNGGADGSAYAANKGSSFVLVHTHLAITAATALDIAYTNMFGKRRHATLTPATAAGGCTMFNFSQLTNPTISSRLVPEPTSFNKSDWVIRDIVNVGNTPVTGSFSIDGITPIFSKRYDVAGALVTDFAAKNITVPAGEELILAVTATTAIATAASNQIVLNAVLENV